MITKDLKAVFPVLEIDRDGLMLSADGSLTVGYRLELPEMFSMEQAGYMELYNLFRQVFRKLPEGTAVHQKDVYHVREFDRALHYDSLTMRANYRMLKGRPYLDHESYLFISLPLKSLSVLASSENAAFKSAVKNPYRDTEREHEEVRRLIPSIDNDLSGVNRAGCRVSRLTRAEILSLLYAQWSGSFGRVFDGAVPTLPPMETEDGYIRFGGNYMGIISMINQGETTALVKRHYNNTGSIAPEIKQESGFALELSNTYECGFGLPFDHEVNKSFVIASKEKVLQKFLFTLPFERLFNTIGIPDADKRIDDIEGFKKSVAEQGYACAYASFNIIIPDPVLSSLTRKVMFAKDAMYRINEGIVFAENTADALGVFCGSTPGYSRGNYRNFLTVVEHALTYFTYETNYRGSDKGHLFVDRMGKPFILDFWDSPYLVNRNGIVEGGSGSGKSFFINNLVDQDLEQGTHVIILDVGHSYRDQCAYAKGRYYDSADLSKLTFNPFLCERDGKGFYNPRISGDGESANDKLNFIHTLLLTIMRGRHAGQTTNAEAAVLQKLVDEYYKYVNRKDKYPVLSDFYAFLNTEAPDTLTDGEKKLFDLSELITALHGFVSGRYASVLNCTENTDLTAERFIVFDISAVEGDKTLFPVLGLIIMELVADKIRKLKGVKKRFIIDEGWKVLQGEMSGFVEYLFRTFRKHDGSVMFATQSVNDIAAALGEDMAGALFQNSGITVLLVRTGGKNFPNLRRHLKLTDYQLEQLDDLKMHDQKGYREAFIRFGTHSMIVRCETAREAFLVFSSKGETKKQIADKVKECGSIDGAILQIIDDERKKSNT